MSIETNPKVTANQLKRDAFLYIPRVPLANMRYRNAPSLWAGWKTKSLSSTVTLASQVHPLQTVKVFKSS